MELIATIIFLFSIATVLAILGIIESRSNQKNK